MLAQLLSAELLIRTGQLAEARRSAGSCWAIVPKTPQSFLLLARAQEPEEPSREQKILTDALSDFPKTMRFVFSWRRAPPAAGSKRRGA